MNFKAIADTLAKLIQARKKKLAPRKTGALANSIKESVLVTKDKITISSKMNDYGFYQDSGVSGVKRKVRKNPQSFNPPGQFTGKWKMIGPMPSAPWGNNNEEKSKSAAIRTKIYMQGIDPQPFIVPAVTQVMDETGTRLLGNAIADNIALEFKKL